MTDQHEHAYPHAPMQGPPQGYPPMTGYPGYPPPGYPQPMPPAPAQQQVNRFRWVNTALIALLVIAGMLAWGAGSWMTSIDNAVAQAPAEASQSPTKPQPRVAEEPEVEPENARPDQPSAMHAAPSLFDDEPTVVTRLEITADADGERGQPTYKFARPGDKPSRDQPQQEEEPEEVAVSLQQPGAELGLQRRDLRDQPRQPADSQSTPRLPARTTDFTRALSAHRAGDYKRAMELYDQVIMLQPTHFGAYNNMGVLHMQMGEYDKAIEVLREAGSINPRDPLVYTNLANCHMRIGQYEQAVASLKQSLDLESDNLAALTNMGIAYTAMGDFESAREVLERAVDQHPDDPQALFNLGNLYRRQRDVPAAMRTYLKFLEASNGRYPEREAQVRSLLSNTGSW